MGKYIGANGLQYLWEKIKAFFTQALTNYYMKSEIDALVSKPIEFERWYQPYSAKFTGSRSTNNGVKVESGTAKINTIYGVTFVWNQLFDAVGTTVTPVEDSTYLLQINGVRSIVVADANTANFVSTTETDMCINLRHLYGAENGATPFTIAQFEEFFPLPYYSYDAGRLINMAITSFTSQGTDKDGNVFYKAINLPITTMTGKLNGIGNSETIFSNGMGNAYGLPSSISNAYADSITKVGGVWKATQRTHFVTINLANVTWSNAGSYSSLYSATNAVMPIGTGNTSSINVVCDKFVSRRNAAGNFVKGYTAMYPGSVGNNTCFILCRDEPKVGTANFAYPKKTASVYVLDDEYQAMLNEVFPTNDGGTEIVYPSNGVAPVTTPVNVKIDYPIIDYEVKRICVENWGGNYIEGEITYAEAAGVTVSTTTGHFDYQFRGNTNIVRFNELKYFKGLTRFSRSDNATTGFFESCNNLTEITLPATTSTWVGRVFGNCSKLVTLAIDGTLITSDSVSFSDCFFNCNSLKNIVGNIHYIGQSINFQYCPLTVESATKIINCLSSNGSGKTCKLRNAMKTTYEEDDDFNAAVTTATAKGWSIAYA